jgi:predicted DNA-binding protein with PD1-like motif
MMQKEVRLIKQPGPLRALRIDSFEGRRITIEIDLKVGISLLDAIAGPLAEANVSGAGMQFKDLYLEPTSYLMPTFSKSEEHVAYYSDTYKCNDEVKIDYANATFGFKDGSPFIHCHALWEEDGKSCGGHVLSPDSIVSRPSKVLVYCTTSIGMESLFDPETNFTIFTPIQHELVEGLESHEKCIMATVRPNEDFIKSIEDLCKRHKLKEAVIRSGIGSTVGANFEDGRFVEDIPTELVILSGRVSTDEEGRCHADVDIALIDAQGSIHKGRLERGFNPVLICFELVITGN